MGLSTHVLDTHLGKPAAGVELVLFRWQGNRAAGAWEQMGHGSTDADGRCRTLLGEGGLQAADYKLRFNTAAYFEDLGAEPLYPWVEIAFTVRHPEQHYHVPLLISANGYSTYRGS
jgi:5-hydroxyisourate hydrolase